MALPQKFLFDLSFDQLDEAADSTGGAEALVCTQSELETARSLSHAEGYQAGLDEAARLAAAHGAAALERLARDTAALLAQKKAAIDAAQAQAIDLLRVIVRKAVPALAARHPLLEIDGLLTECLHEALDEPRLVLRVAGNLYEPMKERLATITAASGFAGKIILLGDDTLRGGDARIEWADGGVTRDTARLAADIDTALSRALAAIPANTAAAPEETYHE